MFELFSCWRSPCCWRTTCSYIHLKVRRVLTKIKQHQLSKERFYVKKLNLQSKVTRSMWKNGNSKRMYLKDWRCMSMLERRITTKDEEVTKGRWQREQWTKNKDWRKVCYQRSRSMKEHKIKRLFNNDTQSSKSMKKEDRMTWSITRMTTP